MHFHLPKPLHGWRAFAGEVGIIVVGVLIALSAEQIVEQFHWRSETQHAREALYDEARDNLGSVSFRQQQQKCVARRLDEIAIVFREHASGAPVQLLGPVARPVYSGGPQSAWEISVASQALAHMTLDEKLGFGGAFSNYANFDQIQKKEQDAWIRVDLLDDPAILNDNDWASLHEAYAEARSLDERLRIIMPYVIAQQNLDQQPRPVPLSESVRSATDRFCRPIMPAGGHSGV
jgi:hypothetical protein